MPIDPGLQTPENYMTPAQLASQREYARHLLENQQQNIRSPWQGVSNMVQALIGGGLAHSADTKEAQGRQQYAQQMANALLHPEGGLGGAVGAMTSPWATPESNKMLTEALVPKLVQGPEGTYAINPLTGGNPRLVMPGVEKEKVKIGDMDVPTRSQFNPKTGKWETNYMLPGVGGPPSAMPQSGSTGAPPRAAPQPNSRGQLIGEPAQPVERIDQGFRDLQPLVDFKTGMEANQKRANTVAEEGAKATMAPITEAAKEVKTAPQMLNSLNIIEDVAKSYGDKITTGPFAEQALKLKQAVNGVVGSNVLGDTAPAEIIKKMNAHLASAAIPAFTQRGTQFDLKVFMDNSPGLNNSIQGTLFLTSIMKQVTRQNLELGKLASDPANYSNWPDVQKRFYEQNPLINPLTQRPLGVGKDTPAQTATVDKDGYTIVDGYRIKQR